VSRVLNNHPNIAPQTRERVLAVLSVSDYRPNELARSLITRKANAIGVVVDDVTNPFYPELVDQLADMIAGNGYRLLLWKTSGDNSDELIRALQARLVDGMIFTAAKLTSPAVTEVSARGHPLVLVNRYAQNADVDKVFIDTTSGARFAAEHLLSLGHTRIAIIGGLDQTSTNRDMTRGFVGALETAGLTAGEWQLRPSDYTYESGYRAAVQFITGNALPVTAIFAMSDAAAIGAMNAARAFGLRVPEDISVVGFDDIAMASWPMIQLTTVAPVGQSLAGQAVDLVLKRIKDPHRVPEQIEIASHLVVRQTTAPPPQPPKQPRSLGGDQRGSGATA